MFRSELPPHLTEDRIRDGELMILDRMCPGGGWNYGNSRVLGEDLWPFPDTTALALMALQGLPRGQAVEESLRALERMTSEVNSGLSLALASICFRLYEHDQPDLRSRLEAEWKATAFRGETRPTALAAIAMQEENSPFSVGNHA